MFKSTNRLRFCRILTISAFILIFAATCLAQGGGFGSIEGTVQDPSGAVVSNAKVIVENPSKGIRRDLVTNAAGFFTAPALVPASGYQVTITATGFSRYEVKEVNVAVGESVTLTPLLKVASGTTQVEVTGAAPVVDLTKTDTSQVIGSDQILDLPTNGRRVDTFVLLTPGVTSDGTFGLLSFRGNPGGNTFLTDGNDTTNQFYNENAGRTRSYNISQDAVQEFQVVSSNFAAEYGKASGGVVNTVTRSGGNAIHGTAYEYFRNRTINAIDRTTVNGLYPNGINPPEWRHQAGLSIGGPIIKNKLFYFFNGELMRREDPIVSSNIGAGAGNNLFNGDGSLKAACGATADQCAAAVTYLKGRALPTLLPRKVDNNLLFGKIDYRPTDRDSLSFSANYVDWRSPNGIQTQLSLTKGEAIGNNADSTVFDRTARASWTHVVSPNAVNEFRFGMFKDRQYDPASASLLPEIGPVALTVNSVNNLGYATNYPRLNPSELRFQIADTYSWNIGKHNLKFGADVAHTEDYVFYMGNRFGSYSYDTLTQFAMDFSGNNAGARNYKSFTQVFGNPTVDINVSDVSAFVQDEWHVTPKLTITPGLRYEYSTIPQPGTCNSTFTQTCHIPGTSLNFAPRFGFAYALDSKTSVHGGYGIYFNRYGTGTLENLFVQNGVYQSSIKFSSANGPLFPNYFAASYASDNGLSNSSASIIYADRNFRNAYSQQADFGIEREIAKNTSVSVSYVWSRGLHLLQTMDTNLAAPTTSKTFYVCSDANCSSFTGQHDVPLYTSRNPNILGGTYKGEVLALQSAGNSYYNGMLVQVNRRYSNWLQGSIAYTYSHAIDYNQGGTPTFGNMYPTSVTNGDYKAEKGSSSLDQRHRLVINAVVSPTFMRNDTAVAKYLVNGWQLSAVEIMASSPATYATIYDQTSVPGTVNPNSTYTINGLGGSTRVPWESTSALNIGSVYRTDARLSKVFPITERYKVSLGIEAFNVLNHLIVSGRQSQKYTATTKTINGATTYVLLPYAQYGTITATQITPDGTTARRAQASVRLTW